MQIHDVSCMEARHSVLILTRQRQSQCIVDYTECTEVLYWFFACPVKREWWSIFSGRRTMASLCIKAIAQAKGYMTIESFATATQLSRHTVSNIWNNPNYDPHFSTLQRCAIVLHVRIADLILDDTLDTTLSPWVLGPVLYREKLSCYEITWVKTRANDETKKQQDGMLKSLCNFYKAVMRTYVL